MLTDAKLIELTTERSELLQKKASQEANRISINARIAALKTERDRLQVAEDDSAQARCAQLKVDISTANQALSQVMSKLAESRRRLDELREAFLTRLIELLDEQTISVQNLGRS